MFFGVGSLVGNEWRGLVDVRIYYPIISAKGSLMNILHLKFAGMKSSGPCNNEHNCILTVSLTVAAHVINVQL